MMPVMLIVVTEPTPDTVTLRPPENPPSTGGGGVSVIVPSKPAIR
jgi:hypothetical protein